MSAFKIGQRVRIVRTYSFPQVMGREAVITKLGVKGWDGMRKYVGYQLDFKVPVPNGRAYVAEACDIEPILYDGNQPVSWEECLWQPEGQAA